MVAVLVTVPVLDLELPNMVLHHIHTHTYIYVYPHLKIPGIESRAGDKYALDVGWVAMTDATRVGEKGFRVVPAASALHLMDLPSSTANIITEMYIIRLWCFYKPDWDLALFALYKHV